MGNAGCSACIGFADSPPFASDGMCGVPGPGGGPAPAHTPTSVPIGTPQTPTPGFAYPQGTPTDDDGGGGFLPAPTYGPPQPPYGQAPPSRPAPSPQGTPAFRNPDPVSSSIPPTMVPKGPPPAPVFGGPEGVPGMVPGQKGGFLQPQGTNLALPPMGGGKGFVDQFPPQGAPGGKGFVGTVPLLPPPPGMPFPLDNAPMLPGGTDALGGPKGPSQSLPRPAYCDDPQFAGTELCRTGSDAGARSRLSPNCLGKLNDYGGDWRRLLNDELCQGEARAALGMGQNVGTKAGGMVSGFAGFDMSTSPPFAYADAGDIAPATFAYRPSGDAAGDFASAAQRFLALPPQAQAVVLRSFPCPVAHTAASDLDAGFPQAAQGFIGWANGKAADSMPVREFIRAMGSTGPSSAQWTTPTRPGGDIAPVRFAYAGAGDIGDAPPFGYGPATLSVPRTSSYALTQSAGDIAPVRFAYNPAGEWPPQTPPFNYAPSGAVGDPTDFVAAFEALRRLPPDAVARVLRSPAFRGQDYAEALARTAESGQMMIDGFAIPDLVAGWMVAQLPAGAPAWTMFTNAVATEARMAFAPAGDPAPPGVDPTVWAQMERADRQAAEALRERLATASAAERQAIINTATQTILGAIQQGVTSAQNARLADLERQRLQQAHEIAMAQLRQSGDQAGINLELERLRNETARINAQYAQPAAPPPAPVEPPFLDTTAGKVTVVAGVGLAAVAAVKFLGGRKAA